MTNNERIIREIDKHCSPGSLLIIKSTGKLMRLFCPFQVMALTDFDGFKRGDLLKVTAVRVSRDLILVYIINRKGYHYYNFAIRVHPLN